VSLRDRILQTNDTAKEIVTIPEWGFDVEVRSMTGAARASVQSRSVVGGIKEDGTPAVVDLGSITAEVVVMCTFDPDTGEQVFTEADRESIMAKNGAAVGKIEEVAFRLSGLTKAAIDKAGKDSSSTQRGDSSSV